MPDGVSPTVIGKLRARLEFEAGFRSRGAYVSNSGSQLRNLTATVQVDQGKRCMQAVTHLKETWIGLSIAFVFGVVRGH